MSITGLPTSTYPWPFSTTTACFLIMFLMTAVSNFLNLNSITFLSVMQHDVRCVLRILFGHSCTISHTVEC